MPKNILAYDEGYDAYELGDEFDPTQCQDWQNGYFDAQSEDN